MIIKLLKDVGVTKIAAAGAKLEYIANNDEEAFERGWAFARKQSECIAFSISTRVGRHKVYISREGDKVKIFK